MNRDWIAPPRTALLIIDLQRDFAAPDGAMAGLGANLAAMPATLAAASRLTEAARGAGVPVIFVGLESNPLTDSPAWRQWRARSAGAKAVEISLCRRGGRGAEFVGPRPRPGETVIGKARYSAFFSTNLNATLRARGVDTLVVCGATTECCVDSSVRDAFHLDYHVFIAADACAAYEKSLHLATLRILALNFAILSNTAEIAGAWRAAD